MRRSGGPCGRVEGETTERWRLTCPNCGGGATEVADSNDPARGAGRAMLRVSSTRGSSRTPPTSSLRPRRPARTGCDETPAVAEAEAEKRSQKADAAQAEPVEESGLPACQLRRPDARRRRRTPAAAGRPRRGGGRDRPARWRDILRAKRPEREATPAAQRRPIRSETQARCAGREAGRGITAPRRRGELEAAEEIAYCVRVRRVPPAARTCSRYRRESTRSPCATPGDRIECRCRRLVYQTQLDTAARVERRGMRSGSCWSSRWRRVGAGLYGHARAYRRACRPACRPVLEQLMSTAVELGPVLAGRFRAGPWLVHRRKLRGARVAGCSQELIEQAVAGKSRFDLGRILFRLNSWPQLVPEDSRARATRSPRRTMAFSSEPKLPEFQA